MITSPTIAAIADALAKAQAEITNPVKDRRALIKSAKGDYAYNYADLANVLDCIRPVLAKHGIAVVQTPAVGAPSVYAQGEKGPIRTASLTITTRLVHGSGEWIEGALSYEIDPDDKIQSLGGAITFMRRYALQAIAGVVAEEDDDGNGASGHNAQTQYRRQEQAAAAQAKNSAPAPAPSPSAPPANGNGRATKSPPTAVPPTPAQRYDSVCEAIKSRMGEKPGHELIMAVRNKYGGEHGTKEQKLAALVELEKTVETGELAAGSAP